MQDFDNESVYPDEILCRDCHCVICECGRAEDPDGHDEEDDECAS